MNIRTLLLPSVTCLGGFALAWVLRAPELGLASGAAGQSGVSQPRATKIVRPAKSSSSRNAKAEDLIKKYADAGYQKDKKQALLDGIGTSEFLPMIEALARKAGFTGLDYSEKQMLDEFLQAWSDRDPDAALAWVLGITNPKDRKELLGNLIGMVAEKDLDKAMELTCQYGRDEKDGSWNLPFRLQRLIATQDPDTMLRLVGRCISKKGEGGAGGELPPGYDFRKALDGLAALESSLKQGEKLVFVPCNLIEEWALRDPAAAWEWLGSGKKVTFNDLADFWKSYAKVANVEDVARLLAEDGHYQSPEAHYRAAMSVFSDRKNPELVDRWLLAMPGDRLNKLNQLFEVSRMSSGGAYDEFKSSFVRQMSPEERTQVFASALKGGCSDNERRIFEPLLRNLGHTDGEIRMMLPPAKTPE